MKRAKVKSDGTMSVVLTKAFIERAWLAAQRTPTKQRVERLSSHIDNVIADAVRQTMRERIELIASAVAERVSSSVEKDIAEAVLKKLRPEIQAHTKKFTKQYLAAMPTESNNKC